MTTSATIPAHVTPTLEVLNGYEDALARGWSPDPRRMGELPATYIAEYASVSSGIPVSSRGTENSVKRGPVRSAIRSVPGGSLSVIDPA